MSDDEGSGDGAPGDGGSGGDGEAPLADLARAVADRRGDARPSDRSSGPFEGGAGMDPDAIWERLAGGGASGARGTTERSDSAEASATVGPRGAFPSAASPAVVAAHGTVTAVALSIAVALYASAAVGLISSHLWILSLPFLALGLIGLVPIAAWRLGIWDPQELY